MNKYEEAMAILEEMSPKVSGKYRGHSLKSLFDETFAVYKKGTVPEAAEALRYVVMEWISQAVKAGRISDDAWDEYNDVVEFLSGR